jgi:hypothetical protein
MNGELGVLGHIAHLIHAVRKLSARGKTTQNHVAVVGEKRFSELVALPRLPRNVKFKCQQPVSLIDNRTLLLLMPRFCQAPAPAAP